MNVLIVGFGSIGRRHLRVFRSIEPNANITVWRQHSVPGTPIEAPEADAVVYSGDEAFASKPEFAVVCNPAPRHVPTALELARRGVHLFIEKPLSHDLAGSEELLAICHAHKLVLMVGYNLRFHPTLRRLRDLLADGMIGRPLYFRAEVGQYLPDWRPGRDYRETVTARAALGGGAVLELSHELDYARWFFGEVRAVSACLDRVSDLDIDVEDTAEITLQFLNGVMGSVHLDLLQRAPTRQCRVIGTEGTVEWNGINDQVRVYRPTAGSWEELQGTRAVDRDLVYRMEMEHFMECIKERKVPLITGEDGLRVVELAVAIKQAAHAKKWVTLPEKSFK